ncbi:hypothetical protein ATO7_02445 [Oceanococcus atlanticus]|uniref:Uncharacterized protein TP-0789 domain-containing protein n=1 Tax=Oceanococcus atlanticus TaxID=1317117 RepID=A0A1Y1SGI8_9GAMM|nr:outer membrane lipoprotein-sorting protein [Oceanococcus atlanticus]ORE88698.1 hypothetical protein ATO7_02445 [Oceanococcus atlanticus]
MKILIVAVGIAWGVSDALAAEPATRTLQDIQACVQNNLPSTSLRQKVELKSTDPAGGRRELGAYLYALQDARQRLNLMLTVQSPPDLAGARYLLVEKADFDDIYVYLPAVRKTRRVMGAMRGQPLWGTDFSYEDLKYLQDGFGGHNTEHLGNGQSAGRAVHHLRIEPDAAAQSAYQSIEIDLDQRTCLLLEARFFDAAGLSKRMTSDPTQFSQVGESWVAGFVTMYDFSTETQSTMSLSEVVYDESFSRNRFNPQTFHLVN